MIGNSTAAKKLMEPVLFTGESRINVATWTRRYELYGRSEQWSEEDQIDYMELFLDGKALKWYERERLRVGTWPELRNEFKRKFSSVESDIRSWRELQQLRQNSTEELEDFLFKIELLFEKSNTTNNEIKFKCLISSLRPEFQKEIIKSRATTYNEAVRVATEKENMDKLCKFNITNDNENEENGKEMKKMMNEIKEMKKYIMKTTKEHLDQTDSVKKPSRMRLSEQEKAEYQRKNACFFCREEGHYSYKCPKGPWNLRNNDKRQSIKPHTLQFIDRQISPSASSETGVKISDVYVLDIMWQELNIVEKRRLLEQDRTEKLKSIKLTDDLNAETIPKSSNVDQPLTEVVDNKIILPKKQAPKQSMMEMKSNQPNQDYSIQRELDNMKANISVSQLIKAAPIVRNELSRIFKNAGTSRDISTVKNKETSNCKAVVTVGTISCKAVIDTGAACCVVTRQMANKLKLEADVQVNEVILTADGQHHHISKMIANVPIKIMGKRFN
ncbi:hypothetical protein AX774_g6403, partial [Zancudomyces culisetae]